MWNWKYFIEKCQDGVVLPDKVIVIGIILAIIVFVAMVATN